MTNLMNTLNKLTYILFSSVLLLVSGAVLAKPNERAVIVENKMKAKEQRQRWKVGFVLPQHYRGDGYRVSAQEVGINSSKDQQWYQINQQYLLVNQSFQILKIVEK